MRRHAHRIAVGVAMLAGPACMLEDDPLFGVSASSSSTNAAADDVADGDTGSTESGAADPSSTSGPSADAATTDAIDGSTGASLSVGSDSSDGASSSDTSGGMTCGDGVQEGTEACDGADFGGATCLSVMGADYDGSLSCTECVLGTSGCCVVVGGNCMESIDCCSGTCSNTICT